MDGDSPDAHILDRFDEYLRECIPVVGQYILPKHLKDMGKDRGNFTRDDVEPLIGRVVSAVGFCAGPEKAKELRTQFRRIAREAQEGGQ